ncbi:hypothetical protein LZ32DRAFT_58594 [Colletotrichum eremochloae]|nr:hypothetical protein LZ32DRAFT_58594 [Colletotrichum eremochloae]
MCGHRPDQSTQSLLLSTPSLTHTLALKLYSMVPSMRNICLPETCQAQAAPCQRILPETFKSMRTGLPRKGPRQCCPTCPSPRDEKPPLLAPLGVIVGEMAIAFNQQTDEREKIFLTSVPCPPRAHAPITHRPWTSKIAFSVTGPFRQRRRSHATQFRMVTELPHTYACRRDGGSPAADERHVPLCRPVLDRVHPT